MGLPVTGAGEEELSLENEMWLFLILGGIEVRPLAPGIEPAC